MSRIADLQELMHTCVEAGYLRGQMAMLPSSDKIRKKDAEDMLRRFGFQKVMLERWVSEGLVREHKGDGNSPKWYSKMQIMETIGAIQYDKVVNI